MTWHTPEGDRYLKGHEARAFRAALRDVIETLELGLLDCSGTLLARQTRKSLLHLFNYVGRHMLRETNNLAPLNAWTEGAIGIVFRHMTGMVENELFVEQDEDEEDSEYSLHWRRLILNASSAETLEFWEDEAIDPTCDRRDVWDSLVESLRSRVLWDCDWEVNYGWESEELMQTLGIDNNYFDWRLRINIKTKEAIRQLGDLCGFRQGEWEGQELN